MAVREELLRNIRSVEPYVPGEQPQHKVVKLNTNENPYPPAPGVERVLKEMDTDRFRLYPDPTADELVGSLADYYSVGKDQVFVGVGSDDVISMCFLTFFNSDLQFFSRILHIHFIKSGQNCIGFHIIVQSLMKTLRL